MSSRVEQAVSSKDARELASILAEVVEAAIAISKADFGTIQLVQPGTSTLELVAQRGFPQWWVDFWAKTPAGQGACGTAFERRKRTVVEDVERSPIFADAATLEVQRRAGVRAVQSTPIVNRAGELLGVFSTHYEAPPTLDEHTLAVLDLLARQAADIIDWVAAEEARRNAATALADSEARLRLITDHVDDALVLFDRVGREQPYFNPAFEKVWGRPIASLLGRKGAWLESVHEDDRNRVSAAYDRMLDGETFDERYRLHRMDGELRWVHCRCVPVGDTGDGERRFVGLIHDITEERRIGEQLTQARKMEAVGALASGVAHDFNNVLQAILGCVDVARSQQGLPERARQYLDRAADAARRGGQLAGQLTAFTRKGEAEPEPVEIDALLGPLALLIQRLLTEAVSLEIHAGAPEATILANAVQVEQVLLNLASNARDAMPDGGTLSIRTETVPRTDPTVQQHGLDKAETYLRLVVEDTGIGMDEETRRRIFEPFYTTKGPDHGTGLGMAMVFAVIDRIGGHIEVDSELGRGTTLSIYLPCAGEPAATRSEHTPEPIRAEGTALLVEDESVVRMTMRSYLEALGFDVLEARSADEAMFQCKTHQAPVDLLVSDVVLPGMRGPQLAVRIAERYPQVAVLLVSGQPLALEEAEKGPRTAVLQKPFGKRELADAIKSLREPDPTRR